jgi:hypothetical protein
VSRECQVPSRFRPHSLRRSKAWPKEPANASPEALVKASAKGQAKASRRARPHTSAKARARASEERTAKTSLTHLRGQPRRHRRGHRRGRTNFQHDLCRHWRVSAGIRLSGCMQRGRRERDHGQSRPRQPAASARVSLEEHAPQSERLSRSTRRLTSGTSEEHRACVAHAPPVHIRLASEEDRQAVVSIHLASSW